MGHLFVLLSILLITTIGFIAFIAYAIIYPYIQPYVELFFQTIAAVFYIPMTSLTSLSILIYCFVWYILS